MSRPAPGPCAALLDRLASSLRGQGRLPSPAELGLDPLELALCLELAAARCQPGPRPEEPAPDPPEPPPAPQAEAGAKAAEQSLILYADGASRGNPGPGGAGAWLSTPAGQVVARLTRYLGIVTNNVAEYQALILGLTEARARGARELRVRLDSELLVRQMQGAYQVKSANLKPLYQQARALARGFDSISFTHVPRAQNAEADRLSNLAIDQRR